MKAVAGLLAAVLVPLAYGQSGLDATYTIDRHDLGNDFVVVSNYGDSHITFRTKDRDTRDRIAKSLEQAGQWTGVPREKIVGSNANGSLPSLRFTVKPWRRPFDKTSPPQAAGAFRIHIDLRGVTITGRDDRGLENGIAFFRHLLQGAPNRNLQRAVYEGVPVNPSVAENDGNKRINQEARLRDTGNEPGKPGAVIEEEAGESGPGAEEDEGL